jgi:hypothetical protein
MSEDDFDAAAAARRATGNARETVEDGATNQARAEGAETPTDVDVGSESTLREMLMSTDPSPDLHDVEDPFDPEVGGTSRIYRGVMKATGVDGLPAIADVVIGVVEFSQTLNLDKVDDEQDDQDGAALEGGGVV